MQAYPVTPCVGGQGSVAALAISNLSTILPRAQPSSTVWDHRPGTEDETYEPTLGPRHQGKDYPFFRCLMMNNTPTTYLRVALESPLGLKQWQLTKPWTRVSPALECHLVCNNRVSTDIQACLNYNDKLNNARV